MAIVRLGGGTIKVNYISDLTDGNNKVIKKRVKGSLVIHLNDIKAVDVYYNNKAEVENNKCRIFHEQLGWMVLNESFEEISHLKMDGTIQVRGFIQRSIKPNYKTDKTKPIKPIKLNGTRRKTSTKYKRNS